MITWLKKTDTIDHIYGSLLFGKDNEFSLRWKVRRLELKAWPSWLKWIETGLKVPKFHARKTEGIDIFLILIHDGSELQSTPCIEQPLSLVTILSCPHVFLQDFWSITQKPRPHIWWILLFLDILRNFLPQNGNTRPKIVNPIANPIKVRIGGMNPDLVAQFVTK